MFHLRAGCEVDVARRMAFLQWRSATAWVLEVKASISVEKGALILIG